MQDLVKQQVQLTRKEISDEVQKASEAAQFFAMGGAVLFVGVFIACFAVVHLIHWASGPAGADVAKVPLWACHAIVSVPLLTVGGWLTWMGREKFQSIHPLQNPATEALEQNVKWATNTK
jgi:hypothetical protein